MKAGKKADDYRARPWHTDPPTLVAEPKEPSKLYPMAVPGDVEGTTRIIKSKEEHEAWLHCPVDDKGRPVIQIGQAEEPAKV